MIKSCKNGMDMGVENKTAIKMYQKLDRLPMGSMIKMHQVTQLEEHHKDRVLLSLVVSKGANKFNKPKEMLAKKWKW